MRTENLSLYDRIRSLLIQHDVAFMTLHHEATRTSEESAAARREPLSIGAKAILLKLDDAFALFVLSAARRIDAGKIRRALNVRKIRFATPEELAAQTGLEPGAVPPFGRPCFDLDVYIDTSLTALDRIAFNAGSLTDSIAMRTDDYLALANAQIFDFAEEA